MSERSGIEIDYCPQCRGVWLDRGELDKIIERSVTAAPPAAYAPPAHAEPRYDAPRGDEHRFEQPRYDEPRYDDRRPPQRRKRESWLSELFD